MLRNLAVAGALAAACCGPHAGDPRGQDLAEQFAGVRSARAELLAARAALEGAKSGSGGAGSDAGALHRAQAAFEAAHAREQKLLAAYLNAALNEHPDRPETREALAMYTESAVENARYLLGTAADGRRAVEVLEAAERCYRALSLPAPDALADTLVQARRFQAAPPTPSPTAAARPRARSRR